MENIEFSIPIVLLKEKIGTQDCYIISCETLGIYSQANTKIDVKQDFTQAVNILFKKWANENKLVSRLKLALTNKSNKLDHHFNAGIAVKAFEIPELELGSLSSMHGSLVAC
jgi:hypothetical protein